MFRVLLKKEDKDLQAYCDLIYEIMFNVGNIYLDNRMKYNHYGQLYNDIVDKLNIYSSTRFIHFDGVK